MPKTSPATTPPSRARLAGVIALAIVGISVSGPLAKLSAAPPLAIGVWRLALSMLIVAVPLLASGGWREWRALSRGDVALALAAGTFLALHFWSWIASLGMTSVAASVLLVNLHPVVIVLGGALWLGERPARGQLLGVLIAMLGAAVVAFASVASGSARVASAAQASARVASAASGSARVASAASGSARVAERDHALRDLTSSRTVPSGVAALGSSQDSSLGADSLSGAPDLAAAPAAAATSAAATSAAATSAAATSAAATSAAATSAAATSAYAPSASAPASAALGAGAPSRARLGNALALLGALTVGLYYLVGRRLRQQLSLWPYVALVYGACLVVLLALAAWQRTPLWPQPPRELGIFALIALGPMLAGHTGFNWALRYVPAVVVSVALLAEPVGAALLAWAMLGETPSGVVLAGGAVVLAGLGVILRGAKSEGEEGGRKRES